MLVKILGIVDIVFAIVLLLLSAHVDIPKAILVIGAVILFVKGIPIFKLDIGSFFDIFAGVLLFLSTLFMLPGILLIIACFLLLQKGAFSML